MFSTNNGGYQLGASVCVSYDGGIPGPSQFRVEILFALLGENAATALAKDTPSFTPMFHPHHGSVLTPEFNQAPAAFDLSPPPPDQTGGETAEPAVSAREHFLRRRSQHRRDHPNIIIHEGFVDRAKRSRAAARPGQQMQPRDPVQRGCSVEPR
ncbi:MAG: hypothetical protein J0H14_08960 [Alphaproteobacteria bacterium]|nr:hypothetical protein [Alphaproteobacteria bacterium]